MARRFSWCSVVALVVLLFVTTEGFRERTTQVDDHKTQSANDRGTLRYNFKSPAETTTSVSTLSRTRSSRDRTSNLERHNAGSVSKPSINSEAKVESNRRSNFRTARTTERNGVFVATETTNTSKTLEKDLNDMKKVEPIVNRRNNRRHPSKNNETAKLKVDEQSEAPKEVSRRMFNRKSDNSGVTEGLDNIGPSVFTATTEPSRSRTGRKIHTTYSTTDLKIQVPTSRKFGNQRTEDVETTTAAFRRAESRSRSTTERTDRGRSGRSKVNHRENNSINRRSQDPLLSESESVRVDVPLAFEATETLTVDATTDNVRSQRQSSLDSDRGSDSRNSSRTNSKTGSERSKHRGRSSHDFDHSNSVSRNSSRRGSSKFNDYSTTEANEQTVSSRRNSISRDRLRNPESRKHEVRSRSRSRNPEHIGKSNSIASPERDAKRKSGDRNSSERRSRVFDLGRTAENRGQDQDSRGRSRSRSRVETTTPVTSVDTITTSIPETTVSNDISSTSTEAEITSTTIAAATPAITTTTPTTTTTTTTSRTITTTGRSSTTTTAASEGSGRNRGRGRGGGNQGRKQKEDFFNQGLGFRGRKISPEGSSNIGGSRKPIASKNESQYQGTLGWTLRRRLGHLNHSETEAKAILPTPKDQTNEVIPPSEQSTSTEIITTVSSTESSTATARRGFKKQQSSTEESSTVPETTTKSFRRGNKSFDKGRTFGLGKGAAEPEESDNYPPEFKAKLSQLKITNVPAPKTTSRTPVEVKKSSAALFAERSRMKLDLARRLVKPELNIEENDLDATTASSFSKPTKSTGKVAEVTTERRGSTESADRGSKFSRTGKSLEDTSKVTLRPSILRKGRIISERMVTSISVEERPAKEETTKSYSSIQPSVVIASAVEESETSVDSTKIRPSTLRDDKKPKEDEKLPRENIDTVATFKPKKSYVYHSRNSKSREQSTTDETFETAAAKKSQNSANKHSGSRRKSQASQEEVTRKPKFTEGVTKPTFRPRYSKGVKAKFSNDKAGGQTSFTTTVPPATSRYSKKKSIIKSEDGKARITTTEGPTTQTKKQDFRPRTATYRRHSEVPTTLVETTTKTETTGVAITPRVQKYHATLRSSTASPRSVPQERQVNLNIVNETQQSAGITDISNGNSGNSNIFNPTKTGILTGNDTLLDQLRSTVAPLLSSLGNRTPIFSGSYSNVNNANAAPRITPNGSPPRFSARYKGAELFVRNQGSIYQPTVPSITSSSTTSATPTESNTPMNAQMGTTSNAMSAIAGRPPTDSQGSRIVQDRERDEATRTKEAGGQRSSVYIGQDKFVNYWTNGPNTANPRVHSVNINSVATAINEGPSTSIPSFENLLNNQARVPMTAPPGFPWRDPFDQIFGITTSSPVITASVASNTLDDSTDANSPVFARPVNPFVEVFTPFSSTIGDPKANLISRIQSATATTTTTAAPLTTTPSATPTRITIPITTTTTTMAPTTTTTTMAPTTTTTTTPATTTTSSTTSAPLTTPTSGSTVNSFVATTPFNTQKDLLPNVLQQNAFGTTFDDLQFLNSLLQDNTRSSTSKTLTQVEQLLANKILSLALNNPGPTRAPKAINAENASPNSVYQSSPKSLDPIVIDLSPSSTAAAPTWQTAPLSSEKPISTTTTMKPTTLPSTTAKTTLISTTKAPIPVTVKSTSRPRTTTPPPPLGFGANLWQALFGNGLFASPVTQAPVRPKQVKTTPKSVNITPKPVPTTQKPETTTLKSVDISKIQVNTPKSILKDAKPTTKQPLPKVATTTSLREDDAKLLLALLRAAQEEENKPAGSKKSSSSKTDDESFLRAILSGQALTTTTPAPSNDISDAALLAALLKAQGIEPPTPATDIREQLLLASLGQNVRSASNALPATESTTITTRPASSATRPTVTTKKTVTPRPTSGPRIRTTTWSPSSTYPPPLFSSFSNYGTSQSSGGNNSGSGALFGATRAFSQLLGAAISGAAQQLQSLVRNGTRLMTGVVG